MLEFLREKGQALKNFLDKDDEREEKLKDFQEAKEAADIALSDEDKKIQSTEDTTETKSIEEILKKESEKKEEEGKEKELDEKLADIEKVISTFGSKTNLSSSTEDPFKGTRFQLNKPIDFQTQMVKSYVAPYLQQPTSQGDRIKLLFESLKKQNLI